MPVTVLMLPNVCFGLLMVSFLFLIFAMKIPHNPDDFDLSVHRKHVVRYVSVRNNLAVLIHRGSYLLAQEVQHNETLCATPSTSRLTSSERMLLGMAVQSDTVLQGWHYKNLGSSTQYLLNLPE